ncbi:MAG: peptidoglycan-binding protein [Bacteroidota bacterium]|nr:peptidoglycan-binding protein [Bacteroidota bacterium]
MKNKNETISLINASEINLLKSEGLKEISFKIVLPAYKYPFINMLQGFNKPKFYLDKLQRLKDNRKPFQFIVSRKYPNNKGYFNTNIKVSLEDFIYSDDVSEFMDITVDIKLKEYKDPRASKLNLMEDKLSGFITVPRPVTKIFDRVVSTGAGEMLWNVCRQYTGGIEKMGELMKLNALDKITDFIPGQNVRLK